MGAVYPRSQRLKSAMLEYFIAVVHLCHHVMELSRKTVFGQWASSMTTSLKGYDTASDSNSGQSVIDYRYTRDPEDLVELENIDSNAPLDSHVYSRYTAPNTTRFEVILRTFFGSDAITYSTGLSASHAMLILLNPKRIFIGDGYHGCHGVAYFAAKARARGAYLTVDATFATPPLPNPLAYGADIGMHSDTKYVGGDAAG
ncbi:hypothetical protein BO78DRAFT_428386 [Aspergillus sclerotiicarbonarius CBS 121057]|uniref:PLP-dependent transferase n=1 Tax=Aspergillus sclerotiicarbonarius (strain CBS 121057 / IBT 28362) TaxID=1448318 RepID=A0A319EZL8_ASPSB|nr:hypothetical protein BO78DRAFT_428386 [Aspergillus sclerotiicarbonarius CBS 121057]